MGIRTELSLRLGNSPGAAGSVFVLLARERINITAFALEPNGILRLIVDNEARATSLLRDEQRTVSARDVLVVPIAHGVGTAAPIFTALVEAGINVNDAYGVDSTAGALLVIGVDDAERASTATGL